MGSIPPHNRLDAKSRKMLCVPSLSFFSLHPLTPRAENQTTWHPNPVGNRSLWLEYGRIGGIVAGMAGMRLNCKNLPINPLCIKVYKWLK